MTGFVQKASQYLGLINTIAGLVLVVLAAYGLRQLQISREATRVACQREAATEAAVLCKDFFERIFPMKDELTKIGFPEHPKMCYQGAFDFSKELDATKDLLNWKLIHESEPSSETMQRLTCSLETFAVFFVKGIADHEIAFPAVSTPYCILVMRMYPVIRRLRVQSPNAFPCLVELFQKWIPEVVKYNSSTTPDFFKEAFSDRPIGI